MCYSPLFGDCYLKDEIARELLDATEEEAEPRREQADRQTGRSDADPPEDEYDILTGGAAGE